MASKSEATKKTPTAARSRLSRSLRKHIRLLKAAGRREEAVALWQAAKKLRNK